MSRIARALSAAAVVAIAAAGTAHAYSEGMHEMLPHHALDPADRWVTTPVTGAEQQQLEAFRRHLYALFYEDMPFFRSRYPGFEDFDAWALKLLLMLAPSKEVWGIDRTHEGETQPRVHWLGLGSRHPDDDRRNQDRVRYDEQREVMRDAWGRPLPDDPAILDMGPLTGDASQAHAHYGLVPPPRSDDPEVLKTEPRLFSIPPDALTFAADFAAIYTDLALLAALWNEPGGEYLSALFAGNAWHHIGDVGNQIHTVQVGIYEFFFDAKLLSIKEELLSAGGLLYDRPSFREIGIGILRNHHMLSEDLFAERLQDAVAGEGRADMEALLAALPEDDADFARVLDARLGPPAPGELDRQFARVITGALIEVSSHEGDDVYRHMREAGRGRASAVGERYEQGDDFSEWVRDDDEARAALDAMHALQARGLQRAATAIRRWTHEMEHVLEGVSVSARPEARRHIARRLVGRLIQHRAAIEQRRAEWSPEPPAAAEVDWRWAGGVLGSVALAAGAVVTFGLRRRRRGSAATP